MLSWTLRRPVLLHVVAWGLQLNSEAICVDLDTLRQDTLRQALFFCSTAPEPSRLRLPWWLDHLMPFCHWTSEWLQFKSGDLIQHQPRRELLIRLLRKYEFMLQATPLNQAILRRFTSSKPSSMHIDSFDA